MEILIKNYLINENSMPIAPPGIIINEMTKASQLKYNNTRRKIQGKYFEEHTTNAHFRGESFSILPCEYEITNFNFYKFDMNKIPAEHHMHEKIFEESINYTIYLFDKSFLKLADGRSIYQAIIFCLLSGIKPYLNDIISFCKVSNNKKCKGKYKTFKNGPFDGNILSNVLYFLNIKLDKYKWVTKNNNYYLSESLSSNYLYMKYCTPTVVEAVEIDCAILTESDKSKVNEWKRKLKDMNEKIRAIEKENKVNIMEIAKEKKIEMKTNMYTLPPIEITDDPPVSPAVVELPKPKMTSAVKDKLMDAKVNIETIKIVQQKSMIIEKIDAMQKRTSDSLVNYELQRSIAKDIFEGVLKKYLYSIAGNTIMGGTKFGKKPLIEHLKNTGLTIEDVNMAYIVEYRRSFLEKRSMDMKKVEPAIKRIPTIICSDDILVDTKVKIEKVKSYRESIMENIKAFDIQFNLEQFKIEPPEYLVRNQDLDREIAELNAEIASMALERKKLKELRTMEKEMMIFNAATKAAKSENKFIKLRKELDDLVLKTKMDDDKIMMDFQIREGNCIKMNKNLLDYMKRRDEIIKNMEGFLFDLKNKIGQRVKKMKVDKLTPLHPCHLKGMFEGKYKTFLIYQMMSKHQSVCSKDIISSFFNILNQEVQLGHLHNRRDVISLMKGMDKPWERVNVPSKNKKYKNCSKSFNITYSMIFRGLNFKKLKESFLKSALSDEVYADKYYNLKSRLQKAHRKAKKSGDYIPLIVKTL
jgi:hypothetical protein